MNTLKKIIYNNKLLIFIALIYVVLLIFMPSKAIQSIKNSFYYIKEMFMIMPIVLILTSLINLWIKREVIENNFGQNSGIKGYIFSFFVGSFSAGPIYAAFGFCKLLLKKGASISNIVIIISTWAVIKIPMLVNEFKFLGIKIMFIRWILTIFSIFIIAYITSKIVKKEEIPIEDIIISKKNSLFIKQEYCIGCGICAKILPNKFKIKDKKAIIICQNLKQDDLENIIQKCPQGAIIYLCKN